MFRCLNLYLKLRKIYFFFNINVSGPVDSAEYSIVLSYFGVYLARFFFYLFLKCLLTTIRGKIDNFAHSEAKLCTGYALLIKFLYIIQNKTVPIYKISVYSAAQEDNLNCDLIQFQALIIEYFPILVPGLLKLRNN